MKKMIFTILFYLASTSHSNSALWRDVGKQSNAIDELKNGLIHLSPLLHVFLATFDKEIHIQLCSSSRFTNTMKTQFEYSINK